MKKMGYPLIAALILGSFSCGLPQTTLLDPPAAVYMGDNVPKLSFNPVPGVERYVLMYKFYWPGESAIDSDRTVFSGSSLSPGYITPRSLGFIQMKKTAGTGGSYPVDTGEITLTGVTGQVILDFDILIHGEATVKVTGAAAAENALYRRVLEKKRDGSSPVSSSVLTKTFFNGDYDFLGLESFGVVTSLDGLVTSDLDGLDGDVFRLFNNPPTGSYTVNAENGDMVLSVVVYSNSYDITNGGAIDSIPVHLGTVEIRNTDWKN